MKKIISIFVLILLIGGILCGCGTSQGNQSGTLETNIGQIYNDNIYEFIDSETGVHYWIYSQSRGYGGMGGMTPRLNSDGTIMVN